MTLQRWMLVPALVAGWLAAAGPASAAVNDEAGLFSADAIKRADQTIQKIQREYGTGLTVDTVPRIPANLEGKFKQLGKDEFFRDWAESKAKRERDKGIYVLICKSPGRVEALVDAQTREKNFTYRNRDELVKKMLAQFGEKKWDAEQINGFTGQTLYPVLRRAAPHYDDPEFRRAAARLPVLPSADPARVR